MLPYEPAPRENPGAFRSVPSHNLVRILSGELPVQGAGSTATRRARAPAAARQAPRFTGWKRLLHALGLYG